MARLKSDLKEEKTPVDKEAGVSLDDAWDELLDFIAETLACEWADHVDRGNRDDTDSEEQKDVA